LLFAEYARGILLAVFSLAAISDLFDGLVARRWGQATLEGAVLDQMVDRLFTISVVSLLLGHALAANQTWTTPTRSGQSLPLLLALACAREIVALPGVVIVLLRGRRLYHVERVGKLATFVQSVALGTIILDVSWALAPALGCAAIGIVSGGNYVRYSIRTT
jgi:CDP-diacylglycerol--glycerol-3-phosphate 3-phosphatidyltransferase